jgi:hypothetical protein
MTKKLVLALGCLALLATFTSAAMADTITFTFRNLGSVSATASGGLVTNLLKLQSVEDDVNGPVAVAGKGYVKTGPGTLSGSPLITTFTPGAPGDVWVGPGLLTGDGAFDFGSFLLIAPKTGTSSGGFDPKTWDPVAIGALLGENFAGYQLIPNSGGWTIHTVNDKWDGTTFTAGLSSAQISFQVQPIPEPGTLALLGSGILGLAGFIRRKLSL